MKEKKTNQIKSPFSLTHGLKKFIRWTLAIICLGYVAYYFADHKQDILILKQIGKLDLFGLALLLAVGHFIYAVRMHIILEKNSQIDIPIFPWLRIFFTSRLISIYAGQAGNIYRGVVLKKEHMVSYTNYISSYLFINWIDLAMGLIYGIIIVSILQPNLTIYNINCLALFTIFLFALILFPITLNMILSKIIVHNRLLSWIKERVTEMLSTAIYSFKDLSYLSKIIISGMFSFFSIILMIYICFRAINVNITLDIAIFYKIITNLINKIMITPSNVGIREIIYGFLSKEFEIGMSQGMLVSLIIRVLGILVITALGIAIGGPTLLKTKENLKEKSSFTKANKEL